MLLIIYGIIGVIYTLVVVIGRVEEYESITYGSYRGMWIIVIIHTIAALTWPIWLISSIIYTLIKNKEEA